MQSLDRLPNPVALSTLFHSKPAPEVFAVRYGARGAATCKIRRRFKPVPTTLLEAKLSHPTIANDGYHLVSRAFANARQAIFQCGTPLKTEKNQRGANSHEAANWEGGKYN